MTNPNDHSTNPNLTGEANAASRGASCPVRSPYRASAPAAAEAPGAGAPGAVGAEAPTEEKAATPAAAAAPRRRLRQDELRAYRVHPRFSDDEFALLQQAASAARMSRGGYVAEAALAAARADDPTAAVADYRLLVKALMAANRQLAGAGNNLNQLTRHLNQDAPWPADDSVHRLLRRVEASIAAVDTAIAQVTEGR